MVDAEEHSFMVEWFDENAGLGLKYVLKYFSKNDGSPNEVSIYDCKNRRMFLKRGSHAQLLLEDLYLGAQVVIHARQYKVVGYIDRKTKDAFTKERGLVTCIFPAHCYSDFGALLTSARQSGFSVTKLKTIAEPQARERVSLAVELVGKIDSLSSEQELWDKVFRGSTNPSAREVRVSLSDANTQAMFNSPSSTATYDKCSLLLIKPHAVKAGHIGAIFSALIQANFEISAAQLFSIQRKEAENFAEVYKGVINPTDFSGMTKELSSGPCIAVEVRAENCVRELRTLCGPMDVEVAKALRQKSLRARFGEDRIKNAVHCTDLEEDGELECQFFFDILLNTAHSNHK